VAGSASAAPTEMVLYSFQGSRNDGANPVGGVVMDSTGTLYGATSSGGPVECFNPLYDLRLRHGV
jgi:hypothetical protein